MGPEWKCKPWETVYPTNKSLFLYYHDPLECIQSILSNPLIQNFIKFTPFCLYESAVWAMRIYSEWLSGNAAWRMQVCYVSLQATPSHLYLEKTPRRRDITQCYPFIWQNQYIHHDREVLMRRPSLCTQKTNFTLFLMVETHYRTSTRGTRTLWHTAARYGTLQSSTNQTFLHHYAKNNHQ